MLIGREPEHHVDVAQSEVGVDNAEFGLWLSVLDEHSAGAMRPGVQLLKVGLDLDADWVLLTACNTAASGGAIDAEPLSGLARAFFYAGARALLVSH